ncbi:MAG: response regulator [Thermodesulfobacteriota bacterium]|nr:response regulator [Thermodesulfobacteriota bacterium]
MLDSKGKTVLFVDDEKHILDVASKYFVKKGYSVLTAENGMDALRLLETTKVDCCVIDINMPKMDGLQLAERIRELDNTIPVIVMTGNPSLDNAINTLKNGVVDFLIKPMDLNRLEICISRVMREQKLFVENIILKQEVEGKHRLEKLNKELVYKIEELDVLNKIMSDVSEISKAPDVYKRVADLALEITHADEARLFVYNESEGSPFEIAGSQTGDTSEDLLYTLPQTDNSAMTRLVMETIADELPLLIPNDKAGKRLPGHVRSLMLVPLKIQEKVFGVLTTATTGETSRFDEKDLYFLSFMAQKTASAIENLALYEHINKGIITTLQAFVKAIEARDPYTKEHSNRVTTIAMAIGKAVGCTEEELDILQVAGPLHDIGKIGIRDAILMKPGRLTDEEFTEIKRHPVIGAEIIEQLGMWDDHKWIIRHHHERFDGSGYPDRLEKEGIPFLARIMSVSDVFDAITSNRAYRKKMEIETALKIMRDGSGTQFDPYLIDVFFDLFNQGKIAYPDD